MIIKPLLEWTLSIFLTLTLKVGRERTRFTGQVLRQMYRQERNLLYNYEFGIHTKLLRYIVAVLFLPTLVNHFHVPKTSHQIFQQILIVIDILVLLDVINTIESYQLYAFIFILRLYRTLITTYQLKSLMGYFQLNSKQPLPKLKPITPPQSEQSISSIEEEPQPLIEKKSPIKPQKRTQQQIVPAKIPPLWLVLNSSELIIILDPDKFDSYFPELKFSKLTIDMLKLQYVSQIYMLIRKQKYNQKAIAQYQKLIAHYLSHIIV